MNSQHVTFEFSSYHFDLQKKEASFVYRILQDAQEYLRFEEKLQFYKPISSQISSELVDNFLHALHLMLGISYWKLYCPSTISIKTRALNQEQAQFWNTVYTKGLGEFFYTNNIGNFADLITFPYEDNTEYKSVVCSPRAKSLLGIGGGKDSIVAGELLKAKNYDFDAYILETQKSHTISEEVIEHMNIGTCTVKRVIDPQLFEKNTLAGAYNGHIPVSAIFAFTGLFAAALYEYSYMIVGNERSANSENLVWKGTEINHQWSKTAEFEKMVQEYTKKYITPSVTYFSLLRPLSEIQIVEQFSALHNFDDYSHIFSSCNRNFKVHKDTGLQGTLWCGECPKCAFVFALLSAYISKEKLLSIFKKNMYADESLVELFRELLGLTGKKPFECVGTFEEMKVAMYMAYEKGEFAGDEVMSTFSREIGPEFEYIDTLKDEVFAMGDMNLIPEEMRSLSTYNSTM